MMYLAREYKRSELAFNSFRQLKIQYPSINLVVFGLEPLVSVVGLPNSEQYISKPNQNELRILIANVMHGCLLVSQKSLVYLFYRQWRAEHQLSALDVEQHLTC